MRASGQYYLILVVRVHTQRHAVGRRSLQAWVSMTNSKQHWEAKRRLACNGPEFFQVEPKRFRTRTLF